MSLDITREELQLAARNHALPLEALRHAITPVGLHYLLIHFDIPAVDARSWRLRIGGRVSTPLTLTLEDAQGAAGADAGRHARVRRQRPRAALAASGQPAVAAGGGRDRRMDRHPARADPRGGRRPPGALSTSSSPASTAASRATSSTCTSAACRSAEALREEVLLAYAVNGQPLPPQHGFPLRLVVPGWYGMTHVKWLQSITVVDEPFRGWQQEVAYHLRDSEDDPGRPVTRILPRSLMVPPGIPDFLTGRATSTRGRACSTGRAWSGCGAGRSGRGERGRRRRAGRRRASATASVRLRLARLELPLGRGARASTSSAAGRRTPPGTRSRSSPEWNFDGFCNNAVQRVRVVVHSPSA